MALITTIKRCLGFAVTDDEEDYEALAADALHAGIPTVPFHQPDPAVANRSDNQPAQSAHTPTPGEGAARLSELLLDIVRNSLASPRFNAELSRLVGSGGDDFQGERARLVEEIRKLKEQSSSNSMLTTELNNLRLSSQRQQRAYTERINELMDQINRMAGKPQAQAPDLPDPLIADLQEQLNSREEQIRKLNETIEALNLKIKLSDEMINNLNKKSAEARVEYKETTTRYEEQIDRINAQLIDANSIIESLNKRLALVAENEKTSTDINVEAKPAEVETEAVPAPKRRKKRRRDDKHKQDTDNPSANPLDDTSWLETDPANDTAKDRGESDDNKRQMSLF